LEAGAKKIAKKLAWRQHRLHNQVAGRWSVALGDDPAEEAIIIFSYSAS
jgi:hypothetical protein